MTKLWYACEHPERENDGLIMWHPANCTGCRVKAHATMLRHDGELTDVERTILGRIAHQ